MVFYSNNLKKIFFKNSSPEVIFIDIFGVGRETSIWKKHWCEKYLSIASWMSLDCKLNLQPFWYIGRHYNQPSQSARVTINFCLTNKKLVLWLDWDFKKINRLILYLKQVSGNFSCKGPLCRSRGKSRILQYIRGQNKFLHVF